MKYLPYQSFIELNHLSTAACSAIATRWLKINYGIEVTAKSIKPVTISKNTIKEVEYNISFLIIFLSLIFLKAINPNKIEINHKVTPHRENKYGEFAIQSTVKSK